MSRRQCVQLLSASTLGPALLGGGLASRAAAQATSGPAPGDHVETATLRPNPEVRISAAFLEMPRPYWLGWPGTTYDLDAHEKDYSARLAQSASKLGLKVNLEAAPLNSEEGVAQWIGKLKTERPHGLLVMLQHMQTWKWATQVAKETGIPLIAFAPVGTAFTGHVAGASRVPGVLVLSTLEWQAVENGLHMIKAKRQFEETRVLWIRGAERNETVVDRLGVKVRAIPRDTFNQEYDREPVSAEVKDIASDLSKKAQKIVEPTSQDVMNAARTYMTAKRLLASEKANALSMDCLGMVSAKLVPTPPCAGWTLLQDEGVTAGCEADLMGALSMMMTSYLLDRPGYMNDPVPETYNNNLIVSHCTSGTRLNGFDQPAVPYILRNHSESALGVSTQVLWPVGQKATLVRFTGPDEMIIDTGAVVSNIDTPPAGGCRTSVELAMDDIEDCRDVQGFHQVVVLGDHRRILEGFCELYGIKHVHSPRTSTFASGAKS